jgi:IQ and AAA domain-containing protein
MVHPQKRLEVKVVLELIMERVIQLRHLIVKWNPPRPELQPKSPAPEIPFPWEYVNLDDILADLKLPPESLEVPVPSYFREDNAAALKLRDKMISGYMQLKHGEDSIPMELEVVYDPPPESLNLEQVMEIIHRNERGRQGKSRGIIKRDDLFERMRVATAASKVDPPEEVAACDIQRVFRGYKARVLAISERENELEFLGMKPTPGAAAADARLMHELSTAQRKRKTEQAENKETYAKALVDLKEEVERDEGPRIRDQLRQERHLWVTDKIAETKDIPDDLTEFYKDRYPALPEPEPVEEAGGKKGKKDDKKGKKEDKKGKKGKKGKKDGAEDGPPEAPPQLHGKSAITTAAFERVVAYKGIWEGKDESYNFRQKHDVELAKEQIRIDVEKELRDSVDEMLKQNLAKIKAQLAGGGKAGKKGKKAKGGKKGKKGKGGKKGKKGKGKGKALPGEKISDIKNLDLDEMLALLVDSKVINSYRPRRICDFVGGCTYEPSNPTEPEAPKKVVMPVPSMAQIRSAITEYAVLPMGSLGVKSKLETCNVKSLMLYGPAGAGKTMMVEAIAHELGALLVNISPSKLVGQFPGKTGPTKLLHLIYKVASENPEIHGAKGNPQAPVVIYMDECEKYFEAGGKKAKVDKNGPSRFKKDLQTYIKSGFKHNDRVIFIGCTRNPEKADKKELKSFFDKFLHLPYPDYPSRLLLWRSFIDMTLDLNDAPPLDAGFDLSTLARISDGFSSGALERCVKKTLTKKRIDRLDARPLSGAEFLNSLALEASANQANYVIDQANFTDFTEMITGLADRRKKLEEMNNPAAGGDDKKKKGKKK